MNREFRFKFHSSVVEDWIAAIPKKITKQKLFDCFEATFCRIYERASVSVSEITLIAVLDRVLYNSSEQFPLLETIQVHHDRLDFTEFKKSLKKYDEKQIRAAFHYLITEFLCVVGSLTGEQLTPILHKELNNPKKGES